MVAAADSGTAAPPTSHPEPDVLLKRAPERVVALIHSAIVVTIRGQTCLGLAVGVPPHDVVRRIDDALPL